MPKVVKKSSLPEKQLAMVQNGMLQQPVPKVAKPALPTSANKKSKKVGRPQKPPPPYPPPPPPPPPPVNNPYYQKFFEEYWEKYAQGYKTADPVLKPPGRGAPKGLVVPAIPPMVLPPPAPMAPATRIANALPQEEYPIKTDKQTFVMATPDDPKHLSEKQCYVRSRLVEFFIADEEDVKKTVRGRRASFVGQVGIRCVYCVPSMESKDRVDRAITYPTTTKKLYATGTDMMHFHFGSCPALPAHVREVYQNVRGNMNARRKDEFRISPKEYWTKTGEESGLIDHVDDDGNNVGVKLKVGHGLVPRSKLPEYKMELFMPPSDNDADIEQELLADESKGGFDDLVAELDGKGESC